MFKKFNSGALTDTRSEGEKLKDFHFEEIVTSASPVNWVAKDISECRQFPIFNQDGSGSCVAQSIAKMLGIMYQEKHGEYVHFSATDVYQRRANKPQAGMAGVDAFNIARKGVTLESLVPSQNMSDIKMDGVEIEDYKRRVGEIFKIGAYLQIPSGDIDAVASVIQHTGKGVMVWVYGSIKEWVRNEPEVLGDVSIYKAEVRHSIVATDFLMHNGKKCLVIEDSWGGNAGIGGRRIISEDFFKARNYFAGYVMNFDFTETEATGYTFTKTMKFGDRNKEVAKMQDKLKSEKVFPSNIESSGYYGSITAQAVLSFQRKYAVASEDELIQLAGRLVGPKTLKALNK
jgi:hypothetical protein